ncbi:dodecin [Rhodospirillum sp. A1_3_36]|uniref:dodecin n=1 Tax=Rhodospirillum sp. A1_3_36 TaxID=3391666 RepID=UPI0039A78472
MTDHVYKKIDLVGTSKESVEGAIQGAIGKASESVRNIDWFEVKEIRGWVKEGQVQHYQVAIQAGFRLDD